MEIETMNTYRAGIDIGSTTVKIALLDEKNNLIYGNYVRHQANTQGAMAGLLKDVREKLGDCALQARITELNNDVAVCNHIIRFFQTDESPRHKAMYLSSAEWLIRTGKQQNNDRAVDKGMQALANVYGNFVEDKDATDEMPDMSRIAITQDVSIVKHDRINYTDEYKRKMARKYGLTVKDMQQIADEESLNATPEKAPDYFDYMEEVMEEKEAGQQAKEMKEEPADE